MLNFLKSLFPQKHPEDQIAALKTLRQLGYTYHGGVLWKPPLGARPNFWTVAHNDSKKDIVVSFNDKDVADIDTSCGYFVISKWADEDDNVINVQRDYCESRIEVNKDIRGHVTCSAEGNRTTKVYSVVGVAVDYSYEIRQAEARHLVELEVAKVLNDTDSIDVEKVQKDVQEFLDSMEAQVEVLLDAYACNINSFKVVCGASNNPPTTQEDHKLIVDVYIPSSRVLHKDE